MNEYEKSWKHLDKLQLQLEAGQNVTVDELLQAVRSLKLQTNADYAAFLLFKAIAPICGYRRHLTEELLSIPLLALHHNGANAAQDIIRWLNRYLAQPNPFDGIRQSAIDWIKWLATQPELIQKHLDVGIAWTDGYFIYDLSKALMPHSKLNEEFITFQIRWKDSLLDSKGALVFFYFSADIENDHPNLDFEYLTEAIAKVDTNHEIKFYACDDEVRWDFLKRMDDPLISQRFPDVEKTLIQTIWIFEGQVLHVAAPSQKSQAVYIDNTRNLLKLMNK